MPRKTMDEIITENCPWQEYQTVTAKKDIVSAVHDNYVDVYGGKEMWKDVTSYRNSDEEKTHRILEKNLNGFRFTIHKHVYYGKEWLLSCHELNVDKLELNTEDIEKAKEKSVTEVIRILKQSVEKYTKAIERLENENAKN